VLQTLFSAGYRPFFLLGALNAVGSMLPWLFLLSGGAVPTQGWPPATLHAHEMIYGTVVPVIAGFLLTAVPNWTDTPRIRDAPLAGLVLLWMLGRVALVLSGPLDPMWVAALDVSFLPVLALCLGFTIFPSRKWRNYPIVGLLAALAVANAAIHLGLMRSNGVALRAGTYGAVYLVVTLMLIISGRVIPLFTRNALRKRGSNASVTTNAGLGALAVALALVALGVDLVQPASRIGAWLALAAAPLLLVRQSGWQFRQIADEPMLWILQLGHLWLALGFACHGTSILWGEFFGAAATHAFTAGAMGTLILGMMPRVALGHGGQTIAASSGTRVMFVLVIVGAILRIAGAMGIPGFYRPGLLVGGLLWSGAFMLFCLLYTRVLLTPRQENS
jgi:uncharacterized protein involved in response to NO